MCRSCILFKISETMKTLGRQMQLCKSKVDHSLTLGGGETLQQWVQLLSWGGNIGSKRFNNMLVKSLNDRVTDYVKKFFENEPFKKLIFLLTVAMAIMLTQSKITARIFLCGV